MNHMVSPEISMHTVEGAEQEKVTQQYEKVKMDSTELIAAIEGAGVALDDKTLKVLRSGEIIAAYKQESVLVVVENKLVVLVLKGFPIPGAREQFSGGRITQFDNGGVFHTSEDGYTTYGSAAERNSRIAEINAVINNPGTAETAKEALRKERDALGSERSVVGGAVPTKDIIDGVWQDFLRVKGDELAPNVLKALQKSKGK